MRWTVRVARVAGSEIRIHLTFFALLALIAGATASAEGVGAALRVAGFVVLLFASVLLHELGHALAARRFGIRTPDITLLPIGGVARVERLPRAPRQELVTALAGPAVTLAIALGLALLLAVLPGGAEPATAPWRVLAQRFVDANVVLLVFNLLPAFPMDGGRVLRAALAMRMEHVRATRVAATVGQGFALVFALVGMAFNPLLVLVAALVFLGARQEAAAAELQAALDGVPASAAMTREFRALGPDDTLADAAALLLATGQHHLPVVDARGRPRGLVRRAPLATALGRYGPRADVARVMEAGGAAVGPDTELAQALQQMQAGAAPFLPVVDGDGRLVGLLTPAGVGWLLMVRRALARAGAAPLPPPQTPAAREPAVPG